MELPEKRAALVPRSGSISYATTVRVWARDHIVLSKPIEESLVVDRVRAVLWTVRPAP